MLAGVRGKCGTSQNQHLCAPRPPVACPISYVGEDYWPVLLSLHPEAGARLRAPPILCMIVLAAVKCLADSVENAHTFLHESSGAAQTRPCTDGEGVGIDGPPAFSFTRTHMSTHTAATQALGTCTAVWL